MDENDSGKSRDDRAKHVRVPQMAPCVVTSWINNVAKEATARAEIYATQGEDELTQRLVGENQWWAKRLSNRPNCTSGEAWRLVAKAKEGAYVAMEQRVERLETALRQILEITPHNGGYVKIGEICDRAIQDSTLRFTDPLTSMHEAIIKGPADWIMEAIAKR